MNELDLFVAAIAIADSAERVAFLDRECAGNSALRKRLECLLAGNERTQHPLDRPPAELASVRQGGVSEQTSGLAVNAPAAREESGAVIAGKYTLLELVGEGGMGAVWRARQSEPVKRFVAVKLIKAGMDSRQVLARFDAERQALALVDHPNISKVLDGGLHEQRPFFVMELVKGVPITEYCDKCKLTPQQRLELFVPVCHAIQHAHQKGIIHRDIKPSNVLIALYDDKPVVKVIDFGVAKATGGALTEATIDTGMGAVVGTPQYMSPEQATLNNLDIDTRSDVYALGVLLYELLTGTPPFSKKDLEKRGLWEMLRVVREEEPQRPSTKLSTAEALPSISASRGTEPGKLTGLLRNELDWIVMKALEKDRTRRYETANGFAADVQRYLSGDAVQAHPPSAAYRLKKFVRRNKVQVIAAGLLLATIAVGFFSTLYQMGRARAAAKAALANAVQADQRRTEAEQAKQLAQTQYVRAEKAYARTADVLDTMVSKVTGDSLSTQTEITAEQKKFLTEVLSYYQEFAGENADDEKTRNRTALAAGRVGEIELRLGRLEEAIAANRKSLDGWARLAAEFPANRNYRWNLSDSHTSLGVSLRSQMKSAEAEEQYRKALAILEKLTAEFPAVPLYRWGFARIHLNLGALMKYLGKLPEQEEHFRQSLAIEKKLAAEFPAIPNYRYGVAQSHFNLGALLGNLGKLAEAEEQYRQSLAIEKELAAEFPSVPDYRWMLATSHNGLGGLLQDLGKFVEAEEQHRNGLAVSEKLAAEFPSVPGYRENLAYSHQCLGVLHKRLRKLPDAEEHYRKEMAIREKLAADFPGVPEYRKSLADIHHNLGALLLELGKNSEAEMQLGQELAIREKLAADFSGVLEYRKAWASGHHSLGIVLQNIGKIVEAELQYSKALAIVEKHTADFLSVPDDRNELARIHCSLGTLQAALGKNTEAEEQYRQARAVSEKLVAEFPGVPSYRRTLALILNNMAWPLASAPDTEGHYPLAGKAVEWARRACELDPDNGGYLNTLGIAHYRTEQWQPTIDALLKSTKLGKDVAHNWLFIAMAYCHLNDKVEAQKWYDRSLAWQTTNQAAVTADKGLQSAFAEAAILIARPNAPDPPPTP